MPYGDRKPQLLKPQVVTGLRVSSPESDVRIYEALPDGKPGRLLRTETPLDFDTIRQRRFHYSNSNGGKAKK